MTTAANLRDALLALAKPTPKQLPPALAGVFPPGCFLRARTAEEDVLMEKAIARLQPTDDASDYEKGMKAVHIALSFSLCDQNGELVAMGEPSTFAKLPSWTTLVIQEELTKIAKAEQAEQGKD
jgi:hypothetical protein